MLNWLSVTTLNLIYIGLMGVGVIYAIIIMIGGALSHIELPHINLPDIDISGHDIDIGGVQVPDSAGVHVDFSPDSDVSSHADTSVRGLSTITIASFITAFGAFGILGLQLLEVNGRWSLLVAAGGGLVVATVVQLAFSYLLIKPQGSSEVRVGDIIGAVGEVITPIPADHVGEIALVARGARITSSARSADGTSIPRGTIVRVTNMVGSVVLVAPMSLDAKPKEA